MMPCSCFQSGGTRLINLYFLTCIFAHYYKNSEPWPRSFFFYLNVLSYLTEALQYVGHFSLQGACARHACLVPVTDL